MHGHWHFTDKYLGVTHSICNLRYLAPPEIPVVFHNNSNYDFCLMIKNLEKMYDSNNFECLGYNIEKYISFSVFLDKKC